MLNIILQKAFHILKTVLRGTFQVLKPTLISKNTLVKKTIPLDEDNLVLKLQWQFK